MLLTKAQILEGTMFTEEFPVEELGGSVKIRALSDGEVSRMSTDQTKRLIAAGLSETLITGDKSERDNMTIEQMSIFNRVGDEMLWERAAVGLSVDEVWTAEETSKLNGRVLQKIVARIMELTVGTPGQVQSFPADIAGNKVENPDPGGISISIKPV